MNNDNGTCQIAYRISNETPDKERYRINRCRWFLSGYESYLILEAVEFWERSVRREHCEPDEYTEEPN